MQVNNIFAGNIDEFLLIDGSYIPIDCTLLHLLYFVFDIYYLHKYCLPLTVTSIVVQGHHFAKMKMDERGQAHANVNLQTV